MTANCSAGELFFGARPRRPEDLSELDRARL
jgi:hypothetical protein